MRVNTTDLQNAFGRYLALAEKEEIIVVKNGRTVAKLMRYTEPEFFIMHEFGCTDVIPSTVFTGLAITASAIMP